jgi:hypothetical protein
MKSREECDDRESCVLDGTCGVHSCHRYLSCWGSPSWGNCLANAFLVYTTASRVKRNALHPSRVENYLNISNNLERGSGVLAPPKRALSGEQPWKRRSRLKSQSLRCQYCEISVRHAPFALRKKSQHVTRFRPWSQTGTDIGYTTWSSLYCFLLHPGISMSSNTLIKTTLHQQHSPGSPEITLSLSYGAISAINTPEMIISAKGKN